MKRRDKEQLMEGEWSHKYKKLNSFLWESNLSDSAVMEWRFISPQALVVATSSYQLNDKRTLTVLHLQTLFCWKQTKKTFQTGSLCKMFTQMVKKKEKQPNQLLSCNTLGSFQLEWLILQKFTDCSKWICNSHFIWSSRFMVNLLKIQKELI